MSGLTQRRKHLSTLEKKKYSIEEAMNFFQSSPKTKFTESLDVSVNLGIDPEKSDQNVGGATSLPSGTGKSCNVAVFIEGDLKKIAEEAGADYVGMEDLAEKIKKGEDNFDVVIATPETMKLVSPLGRILGPKGLMPNPKTGTVTKDVENAVKRAKAGQIRYKSDNGGIVHGRIGDLSYTSKQIAENVEAVLGDLQKNKPASSKGIFLFLVSISSTMGAGIEIDLSTLKY